MLCFHSVSSGNVVCNSVCELAVSVAKGVQIHSLKGNGGRRKISL